MQGMKLREFLRSGRRVYGTNVIHAAQPEQVLWLTGVGLDFVFICSEHIAVDRRDMSWMCHLFAENGISPMVRIPYPSAHLASMVIDGGAQGVVAPYVESIQEVDELIGAVRYRPIKGRFLDDIVSGTLSPAAKLTDYLAERNKNFYLIVGIESVHAIENLENLVGREEVDAVFLGPHDISCSLEIPEEYDNPIFVDIIKSVIRTCRKLGKGVGLHANYDEGRIGRYLDEGANFVLHGSDTLRARRGLEIDFAELRSRFGDTYTPGASLEKTVDSEPTI